MLQTGQKKRENKQPKQFFKLPPNLIDQINRQLEKFGLKIPKNAQKVRL
jgi:hypothetical protein